MSNRAELLKSIVKNSSEINEDAALDKYLLSRGINPKFATKDQKVAHSKTNAFITWKNSRVLEGISMMHTPTQQRLHALKKSQHVNKEIRVADGHKQLHPQNEAVDKKDTVTLDIPLLIRVLELAREDIRTDMDLHRVVEKLINIRNKGMLTMKDYNYIAKIHEDIVSQVSPEVIDEAMKTPEDEKKWEKVAQARSEIWRRKQLKKIDENHVAIAMGQMLDDEGSMILNQLDDIDRCSKMIRDYVGTDYEKQMPAWVQSKVTLAADYINTVGNYLMSKNEEVEQVDEVTTDGYHKAAVKSRMDAAVKVASSMGADKQARTKLDARNRGLKRLSDRTSAEMKKANSGPQKPREVKTPSDAEQRGYGQGRYMGDSVEYQDTTMVEAQSAAVRWQKALEAAKKKREEQERRNKENAERALAPKPVQEAACACEMSKSARIIKSIYKKKGVAEETYDHEKDDKSVSSYGKKPKMATTKKEASFGENVPTAAAVLKGGTTLTGQTRDTVEIDPIMRKRPGPDVTGKTK